MPANCFTFYKVSTRASLRQLARSVTPFLTFLPGSDQLLHQSLVCNGKLEGK
jgi:hypothetical protein